MSKEALRERVQQLAEQRIARDAKKAELAEKKQAFDNANRELAAEINRLSDAVASSELMVRTLATELFEDTHEKKPVAGVEVKIGKVYEIDEAAGLVWAKEKQLCLIPASLDVAAVKKLATVQPLPFVKVMEEPKPQIATDLQKALAAAEVASA